MGVLLMEDEYKTDVDNKKEDVLLVVDIRQIEEIINKILEFNKKFLQDEEGNKLTSWSIGGFLKQMSSYIQEGFNTLIDSGNNSYRIFEDIIKQFALNNNKISSSDSIDSGLIESEKYRKIISQQPDVHDMEQKNIIEDSNDLYNSSKQKK